MEMITRIHQRALLLFIAFMIFWNYNEVVGLSKKEHQELERQLKRLNKPAIKSIKTEYGDIYDCVDFYQQPAFDHIPLAEKQTYHPQMKPTFYSDKEYSTFNSSLKVGLKDGGCPRGSVPIRRITKEDLIRERNYVKQLNASDADSQYQFALAQTADDPNSGISGVTATMSIYQPIVQNNQWSASVLKVKNGGDQIQAGWRVDPILYGDTLSRFFIAFKSGLTECFNTRCPGFVIVSTVIPLDHVFPHVSTPSTGDIWAEAFSIQKDIINGRWWLGYGRDSVQIGFWRTDIFNELKGFASQASWGGEVFSSGTTFPPMGAGEFPTGTTTDTAYNSEISITDSQGNFNDPENLSTFHSAPGLYGVVQEQTHTQEYGHIVFFGGPGSN